MTTMGKKALAVILSVALLVSTASVALFVFAGDGDAPAELTLAQWVAEADKLTEATYTEGWDAFAAARTAAKAVAADAPQADKDAAAAALKTAWQGLKKEEYVKLADPEGTLTDATEADGLPLGDKYLEKDFSIVGTTVGWAVTDPTSVEGYNELVFYMLPNDGYTGNKVTLTVGMNVLKVDSQTGETETLEKNDWPGTWQSDWFKYHKKFTEISGDRDVVSLKYVNFKNQYTGENSDLVTDSLKVSALYGLKLVGEPLPQPAAPVDPISDVPLSEWVAQGKLLKADGIDAAKWSAFKTALDAAEALAGDEAATQTEINDTILTLKAAWMALKKVEYVKLGDPSIPEGSDLTLTDATAADGLPAGAKYLVMDWSTPRTVMGWNITDPTDITGCGELVFYMEPPAGYDSKTAGQKLVMNQKVIKTAADDSTSEAAFDTYPTIWWSDWHEYGVLGSDAVDKLKDATAIKYASIKNFDVDAPLAAEGVKVSTLYARKTTKFPTPEDPVQSDKSALEDLLETADTFKADKFLSSTFGPFAEAVTAAKEVAANDRANQAAIDGAKAALLEAWGKLRYIVQSDLFLDYDKDVEEPVLIDKMADAMYLINTAGDHPVGTSTLKFLQYQDSGEWGQMQFQNGDNMDMDGYDALELYIKRDGITAGGKLMLQIFTATGHYDYNHILEPGTDDTWATKLQIYRTQFENFAEDKATGEWVGTPCPEEEFASIGSVGFAYLNGLAGKLSISSINKVKTIAVAAGELPDPNGGGEEPQPTDPDDGDDTDPTDPDDGDDNQPTSPDDGGDGDDGETTAPADGGDEGDGGDSTQTGDAGLPLAVAGLALLSGAAIIYTMKKSRA